MSYTLKSYPHATLTGQQANKVFSANTTPEVRLFLELFFTICHEHTYNFQSKWKERSSPIAELKTTLINIREPNAHCCLLHMFYPNTLHSYTSNQSGKTMIKICFLYSSCQQNLIYHFSNKLIKNSFNDSRHFPFTNESATLLRSTSCHHINI